MRICVFRLSAQPSNHDDAAFGTRLTGDQLGVDGPTFSGSGQFTLYILSLGEQSQGTEPEERLRQSQQLV
jgi:hypothetical protein